MQKSQLVARRLATKVGWLRYFKLVRSFRKYLASIGNRATDYTEQVFAENLAASGQAIDAFLKDGDKETFLSKCRNLEEDAPVPGSFYVNTVHELVACMMAAGIDPTNAHLSAISMNIYALIIHAFEPDEGEPQPETGFSITALDGTLVPEVHVYYDRGETFAETYPRDPFALFATWSPETLRRYFLCLKEKTAEYNAPNINAMLHRD